jgi:two-component system, NtrC family, response regulator HydG
VSPSPPEILVHLPGRAGTAVTRELGSAARVERVDTRGAFLAALGASPGWRVAVLLVEEDQADRALVGRVAGALPSGLLVVTHPDPAVERVVAAESAGAAFLLGHPPDPAELAGLLAPYLAEGADVAVPPGSGAEPVVVGSSTALTEAYRTAARVAPTPATVLVLGESGTGKELVARAVHERSDRRGAPFVTVNCAALPDGLLEAELFGYERGAFTGAVGRSEGRFGRAHGGTLFLDEVGEMGLSAQAKLLRALDSGEIERLGGGDPVRVDVRVVAATNRDLEARVREGAFREDLLYRLAVIKVHLPPLRDRPDDLLPLAFHFAGMFAHRYGRPVRAFSDAAVTRIRERPWPGNVRELRNVMDRAVLLSRGGVVRSIDIASSDRAPRLSPPDDGLGEAYPATLSLREVEERHIRRVLRHTGGHLADAAAVLGVHRNTVATKVRQYGIDVENPAPGAS